MSKINKPDAVKLTVNSKYELPKFPDGCILYDDLLGEWITKKNGEWQSLSKEWVDPNNGTVIRLSADGNIELETPNGIATYNGSELATTLYVDDKMAEAEDNAVDLINNSIPSGVAFVYTGDLSEIPSGWAVANGTGGTDNLGRRRGHPFIVKL